MNASEPNELSVIAPCYNEAGNIPDLVRRILTALECVQGNGELVLVDDGSADGTWEAIVGRGMADTRVRGVRHTLNQGIECAWRSGLGALRGRLVCLIDGDLQNRPEDIPRLYASFVKGGVDLVQAVRRASAELHRHRVFTRGLNFILNLAFGSRLRDGKSGFVLCNRDTLSLLLAHRFHYRYYQAFIGAAAVARGLRVAEVDTAFEPRRHGQSFLARFPLRVSLRILWELIKFRVEAWMSPGPVESTKPNGEAVAALPRSHGCVSL